MTLRRVALVTQSLWVGGTQTYLLGLVEQLTRMGIEVLVAAKDGPMTDGFRAAGAEMVLLPQLSDHTAPIYSFHKRRLAADYRRHLLNRLPGWRESAAAERVGWVHEAKLLLKRMGARRYSDHDTSDLVGTPGLVHLSRRLAEEFRRFQPDMVLTSQLQPTVGSLLARRLARGRFPVHEFVMSLINCTDMPAPWWMHDRRLGDRLLSTTREITEELSKIRPSETVLEVGNCIDDEVFAPCSPGDRAAARASYGFGPDDFVIMHMSSLSEQKWPMARSACEAFIRFLESGRRGKFALVGQRGEREDDFRKYCYRAASIAGRECMFHLGVANTGAETAFYLNMGDAFVGIARCVREAMLCEIPSIVYGLQGHPGIIGPDNCDRPHFYNFSGRGCDRASDPANLAVEFAELLDMRAEDRKKLGEWSREFVRGTDTYSFLARQLGFVGS